MAFIMAAMFWGSGYAADNSVYIDQAGDNATISVTQDGGGNKVRGLQAQGTNDNTIPAKIRGDSANVTINQVGSSNIAELGINAQVSGQTSVNLNYSTIDANNSTGSNNYARFELGIDGGAKASNTVVNVTQVQGGNTALVKTQGDSNTINVNQSGGSATFDTQVNANNTTQTITTSGGTGNSVTTRLTGDGGTVTAMVNGASNTISVTQDGPGGTNGHSAVMNINGTGNAVNISQSGSSGDNIANLKIGSSGSASNSNTVSITQRN